MTTTSRREERRALQHDLSRTQLLDAAEEVFGAKGYHEATLKEVADLAEFSVGSVYSFFENKDDLYLQVFLRRGAEMVPAMEDIASSDESPRERLHALVDFEVDFFRQHPRFARLYLHSGGTPAPGPELPESERLAENYRRAMDAQAEIFRSGQAAGQLRGGDPVVLARLLSGLIYGFQSTDPAVVGSDTTLPAGTLTLDELHEIVDGAFTR